MSVLHSKHSQSAAAPTILVLYISRKYWHHNINIVMHHPYFRMLVHVILDKHLILLHFQSILLLAEYWKLTILGQLKWIHLLKLANFTSRKITNKIIICKICKTELIYFIFNYQLYLLSHPNHYIQAVLIAYVWPFASLQDCSITSI